MKISSDNLRGLMEAVFGRLGVPSEERAVVADVLLEASLAGYDSHGVMRVPVYVEGLRRGVIRAGAEIKVIQETTACAYLDAGRGLGPVAVTEAVRLAGRKALEAGVGCVSVVNANDIARLGGYVAAPAREGLVTLLMVNDAGGGASMAPWGGVEALFSTNPIAAGIPREGGPPVVIDVSTSVTSVGRLKMLANLGAACPEGWLIDAEGKPSTDPGTFFRSPQGNAILPLGGMVAGHKGFALNLLVDILAGGVSGAGCSRGAQGENGNGVFVIALDPERFVSRDAFRGSVEALVQRVKASRRASGTEEILIPGERAFRERARRLQQGIPVDPPTLKKIQEILQELGLEKDRFLP